MRGQSGSSAGSRRQRAVGVLTVGRAGRMAGRNPKKQQLGRLRSRGSLPISASARWRCRMKIDVSGKTALVTGSTAGIGRAIAVGLAGAGADVIVNGRSQGK